MERRDQINSSFHWTGPSKVDSDAEQAVSRSRLIPAMMSGRYSRPTPSPLSHQVTTSFLDVAASSAVEEQNGDGHSWDGIRSLCPCGKLVFANGVVNQATNTRPCPYLLNLPPSPCPISAWSINVLL